MLCENCKKNSVTTNIKTSINGKNEEYNLCQKCAEEIGYGNVFSSFEFNNIFSSFFGNALPAKTGAVRCEKCGSTYSVIRKTGKVGCANCYYVFKDELIPIIKNIHGNIKHVGNKPNSASKTDFKVKESNLKLEYLKKELKMAIDEQNFEYAAKLRDEINELEGV